MYKLQFNVKDYNYRKLHKNRVFYRDKDDILICRNLESFEVEWKSSQEVIIPLSTNNFFFKDFYFITNRKGTYVYDIKTGKRVSFFNDTSLLLSTFNNHSLFFFVNSREKLFGRYDFMNKKRLWKFNYKNFSLNIVGFNKTIILLVRKTKILCLSFEIGSLLWQKDLSEEKDLSYIDFTYSQQIGKIKKCIAIYENKIYLAVNNDAMVILDVESGSILNTIIELPEQQSWRSGKTIVQTFPAPHIAVFIPEQAKIVGLCVHVYWELDLTTDTVNLYDCQASFEALNIVTEGNIPYIPVDEYLVFCANNQLLVAFDRQGKNIAWHHQFELGEGNGLFKPSLSISGNWMIVNDNEKNTYIFRKK